MSFRSPGDRTDVSMGQMSDSTISRWELLDLSSAESRGDSLQLVRSLTPRDGIGARSYDIEWRLGPVRTGVGIPAYVLMEGGSAKGWAPFFYKQNWPLAFRLGEVAIGSAALCRLTISRRRALRGRAQQGISSVRRKGLVPHRPLEPEGKRSRCIRGPAGGHATYGVLAGEDASDLEAMTIQLGAPFDHQFIAFPGSFKEYLQQMGSRSRQSVQYSARRLEKDMAGQVECASSTGPSRSVNSWRTSLRVAKDLSSDIARSGDP